MNRKYVLQREVEIPTRSRGYDAATIARAILASPELAEQLIQGQHVYQADVGVTDPRTKSDPVWESLIDGSRLVCGINVGRYCQVDKWAACITTGEFLNQLAAAQPSLKDVGWVEGTRTATETYKRDGSWQEHDTNHQYFQTQTAAKAAQKKVGGEIRWAEANHP